jgi:hypothetical protein
MKEQRPRNWYAVTAPGVPGKHRLRAEDTAQAGRLFRLMFPNASEPTIIPTTEEDAFNHPLGQ